MPWQPLAPCRTWRCSGRATHRGLCSTCAAKGERLRTRLEPWRRWYRTAKWRALRTLVLARDRWCVHCAAEDEWTVSRDVDHVVPHRGDRALFFDPDNLQGLCIACHSRKTQAEVQARRWGTS